MICIWSDISLGIICCFWRDVSRFNWLVSRQRVLILSHRCHSQNFRPPHPRSAALSECSAWLHFCYHVLYTPLIAVRLVRHALGLSCPWSAVPTMYRRLQRLGLRYAVMCDWCFTRLLVATIFYMLMEHSIMKTCHVGCNGCLWQGADAKPWAPIPQTISLC